WAESSTLQDWSRTLKSLVLCALRWRHSYSESTQPQPRRRRWNWKNSGAGVPARGSMRGLLSAPPCFGLPTSTSRCLAQIERAHCIVPQDLAPARVRDRLLHDRFDSPWESPVRMRIVGVPQKVVVADNIERRLHRGFV